MRLSSLSKAPSSSYPSSLYSTLSSLSSSSWSSSLSLSLSSLSSSSLYLPQKHYLDSRFLKQRSTIVFINCSTPPQTLNEEPRQPTIYMQKKSTKSYVSQPKTKLKKNYGKPTSWHILTVLGIYCQILAKKQKLSDKHSHRSWSPGWTWRVLPAGQAGRGARW